MWRAVSLLRILLEIIEAFAEGKPEMAEQSSKVKRVGKSLD